MGVFAILCLFADSDKPPDKETGDLDTRLRLGIDATRYRAWSYRGRLGCFSSVNKDEAVRAGVSRGYINGINGCAGFK